jgi:hypothetical protein
MTAVFQLLAFAAGIVGLVAFGFYRDRKEHRDERQREIYFPEHSEREMEKRHRGAAMSRVE